MTNTTKPKLNGLKKYAHNTSWLLLDKILRLITGLFIGLWVARYLKPESFGDFSYALSICSIPAIIISFGINSIVVRELVNRPEDREKIIGSTILIRFFTYILCALLLYIVLLFLDSGQLVTNLIWIIYLSLFFDIFISFNHQFEASVQAKLPAIAQVTANLISSSLKVYFILNHHSVQWFAIALFVEKIVYGIILFSFYKKMFPFTWAIESKTIKLILKAGIPLLISGIAIKIYSRIDQIMIHNMMSAKDVGYYSAAYRLVETWFFIPVAINSSLFPAIVNAKKNSLMQYETRLKALYETMFVLGMIVAIIVTLFSRSIIQISFGSAYEPSAGALVLLIWNALIVSLGVVRSNWLITENLQNYAPYYLIAAAMSNIALNQILIPRYGIQGASLASVVSSFSSLIIFPMLFKELRPSVKAILESWLPIHLFKYLNAYRKSKK